MMMRRVFCVVLAFALLCCCSCVFAVEEGEEQEQEVLQVNAECAGKDKLGRWQLPGNSMWYNCTVEDDGVGKEICDMGDGNCTSEASQSRIKDGLEHSVFTINVTLPTPSVVKSWWESNVKSKAVTIESVPAKPPAAESLGSREHKASGGTSTTNSESSDVEDSADVPPPPQTATPGGAVANSSAGTAASQASDSAPAGGLQGPSHSASVASPAPESTPDPRPTEGGDHSSHDPPVKVQEETAAAPPTQLSQTGEDGGAAEGTEEDTAANTTDTASSEGNATAASIPAPLSSAPKNNAPENSVGTDACFHYTRLHALPPLVLAVLAYGTLG
ncbi:serine-alanine-and proline-rich protein [Trypanosoma cruzi]|uniref:Serine-alanine-and proline-rich protein, putative n=1 Tax=Trypanosoma cruzi (strain CL Brener) TaxID=353153 RepID=Q4DRZ6_TRYCC|nr:serine-alanine-and proline-rich protein, putative [Trypanosoma cruzi]EAN95299.1 serine-alanine-and proline-rich protein, putative [Trypanosoma cruzi]RNC39891.1 serine-alanine-and proline-rich protein [Trypanosoma cruzi]|eukprot:XP_817150.1 serine-alanine-and proline-rich protein [Trypanosoma cruzi strain CL Brener]